MPTVKKRSQNKVIMVGEGGKRTEQRSEQEALDLDPFTAELLDGENSGVVPRDEAEHGNDDVPDRDFEEALPWRARLAIKPDLLQDDVLVQIDTIERDIK